jgi:hypothetical protein
MSKKKPGLPAGCALMSNAEETCWFGRDPGVAARLYPSHHLYDQRSLSKGEKQCPCFFAKNETRWSAKTGLGQTKHEHSKKLAFHTTPCQMTAEVRAPTEDIEMALLFHTYLRVGGAHFGNENKTLSVSVAQRFLLRFR